MAHNMSRTWQPCDFNKKSANFQSSTNHVRTPVYTAATGIIEIRILQIVVFESYLHD